MSDTTIEWTDATWNPVTGCTKVSQGCKNCYAERVFPRAYGRQCKCGHHVDEHRDNYGVNGSEFVGQCWARDGCECRMFESRKFTDVRTHPDRLDQPLHWRKPRRIFVNSMSDLFHEDVPLEFIDKVFVVMALCPQHTFQILTKRPLRMFVYLNLNSTYDRIELLMLDPHPWMKLPSGRGFPRYPEKWPLPSVWLGVSVEDQLTADERIPLLLQTPAAVRFVSAEPLISPVDLSTWLIGGRTHDRGRDSVFSIHGDWSVLGEREGRDMETSKADSWQPNGNTAILEEHRPDQSGAVGIGRLPNRDVFRQEAEAQGVRPSGGLDGDKPGRYTGGTSSESQERNSGGHDAGEFRDGHAIGEQDSFNTSPRPYGEGECQAGRSELMRKGYSAGRADDPIIGEENVSVSDSATVRHQAGNSIRNHSAEKLETPRLDWIIAGSESGPKARPAQLDWYRSVRDQCVAAGVPFFFKQHVENGKKISLPELDGKQWAEFPEHRRHDG